MGVVVVVVAVAKTQSSLVSLPVPLYCLSLAIPLFTHFTLLFDYLETMTDMYDEPPVFDGKLKPYPHAERPEVSMRCRSCQSTRMCVSLTLCVCVCCAMMITIHSGRGNEYSRVDHYIVSLFFVYLARPCRRSGGLPTGQ